MPLPFQGSPISINDIRNEFTNINATDLNSYRGVTWYTRRGISGTFSTPLGMDQFYAKQRNNPGPFQNSVTALTGSNNYLGGKRSVQTALSVVFNLVAPYQNGRSGWTPLLPGNLDSGIWQRPFLAAVHPESNWQPYLLDFYLNDVNKPILWGRKYEFTSFGVQQERGTILSYGKLNLNDYVTKRYSGGNLPITVFNSYQNGGAYDGSSDGRVIPAVLWSHHWSGGSGYADWRYGYQTGYTFPEFLPGRYGVFWASAGTVQGSAGTFLSSYTFDIGVDDLVFPVVDDQNDGGSWNMSLGVQAYW